MQVRDRVFWGMFGVAVSMGIGPGNAQDLVWRCGQTLTNRLPEDEGQRGTCVPVSLPKVTTLPAPRFAPVASPPSAGLVPRNERVQVDPLEQKNRDQQSRELLLEERQKAQARLQRAEQAGDRTALEHARADLASLDRELARRP